jgi:hypothetical protein
MDLVAVIIAFCTSPATQTLLALILLDVVFGVAVAARAGAFRWARLADFLGTNVLRYVGGGLVAALAVAAGVGGEALAPLAPYTAGAAVPALLGSLLQHLAALGVPLPLPGIARPTAPGA